MGMTWEQIMAERKKQDDYNAMIKRAMELRDVLNTPEE